MPIANILRLPGSGAASGFVHCKYLTRLFAHDGQDIGKHDVVIIGGLLVGIVAMVLVSNVARKSVQAAVTEVGG